MTSVLRHVTSILRLVTYLRPHDRLEDFFLKRVEVILRVALETLQMERK